MTKYLFIAGHGKKRDGTFDPGAKGFISMGETLYYKDLMFPAMKKYVPPGHEVNFFSDYNVYDRQNLAQLAKGYDEVIEWHYDASPSNANARGGHVIIYAGYKPDALDLRIRDGIKNTVGIWQSMSHLGHLGISGRSNLLNPNIAAQNRISYRLVELGFCTNKKDAEYMLNNIDTIAKELCRQIFGSIATTSESSTSEPKKISAYYKIDTDKINIHEKAWSDSKIIASAKQNEVIFVSEEWGNWVYSPLARGWFYKLSATKLK